MTKNEAIAMKDLKARVDYLANENDRLRTDNHRIGDDRARLEDELRALKETHKKQTVVLQQTATALASAVGVSGALASAVPGGLSIGRFIL